MEKLEELNYLIKENKTKILFGGFILLFLILVSVIYVTNSKKIEAKEQEIGEVTPTKELSKNKKEEEKPKEEYRVDIKGEVKKPGVYTLNQDKRVIDVINKANGLTKKADTTLLNLSKKITDEMVIIVYTKEEVEKWKEKKDQLEIKESCEKDIVINNDACLKNQDTLLSKQNKTIKTTESNKNDTSTNDIKDSKISLNKATLEQLMTLSGIGESKAKAIIKYREEENGFKKIEDIMNISGIGTSLFEKIKDNITI